MYDDPLGYDELAAQIARQQQGLGQTGEYVPYAYPGGATDPRLRPAPPIGPRPVTPGQMPTLPGAPGFRPEVEEGVRSPSLPVPNFALPWIELFKHKAGFERLLELYTDTYSPFWYGLGPLTLAIGGSLTSQTVTMNTDSVYMCTALMYKTDLTGAQILDSQLNWRLGGSGTNLMDNAIPIEQICWVSGSVYGQDQGTKTAFDRPVGVLPGNTVVFDFNDTASAAAQTFWLTMVGYKFYRGSRPGQ